MDISAISQRITFKTALDRRAFERTVTIYGVDNALRVYRNNLSDLSDMLEVAMKTSKKHCGFTVDELLNRVDAFGQIVEALEGAR